ncbi:MAG: DUF5107 domain-containing protein [Candidatus Latescibacterota bacterium]|jgi:tetratricopeptide (TPR) repeat protein
MSASRAIARSELLSLPTYPVNAPDPNPPIEREWGYWRIYPYTMLDDLGSQKEERTYLALILENEYLRLTVLPELGGRLYSAWDKLAGREVFYRTRDIKPALVALRGAWIAGGIEFNFPCSHNYMTLSPVDWWLRQDEDGSATAFVGAIEQVSRVRWTVGISLKPGRRQVFVDVRLENRTLLPHRYYFWSNSAERVTRGTRFLSPLTSGYGWKGIMRYPIHDGEDISWYRHHPHALDLFSRHLQGDFFGCYDYEQEEGVVNVADRREVAGRKYFTWGHSPDGLVWQHTLSDGDGPYIEIQSGPYPTQGIFKMLEPHRVQRWQETWYGVWGMSGFEFANQDVALNLVRDEEGARITGNANREIVDAVITASQYGTEIGRREGSFGPAEPLRLPVKLRDAHGRVEVVVASRSEGEIARALLPWEGEEDELTDPELTPEERDTATGLCSQGYGHERGFDWDQARDCYERALARDPRCVRALVRLGVLDLKSGRTAVAEQRFTEALRLDEDEAEARFFRGQARWMTGNRRGAEEDLGLSWRTSRAFASQARYLLGGLAVEAGDLPRALDHFAQAAELETPGTRSWCMRCATLRTLGRADEAAALVQRLLHTDPLNPLLRFELGLAEEARGHRAAMQEFRHLARGEAQTYLELATDYVGSGFTETAVRVLQMAVAEADATMVRYFLGYYLGATGHHEEARAAYREAAEMSGECVFPHRLEAEAVLRQAISVNPEDANAPFYLGTMLYMLGRHEEGRALWLQAVERGCGLSALYRSVGWVVWRRDHDPAAALSWYDRALGRRPDDYRLYIDMDEIRESLAVEPAERLQALLRAPAAVREKGSIAARVARLQIALGEYDQALAVLQSRRFDPWEGARGMRTLWVDGHLGRGEELLDAGDPAGARREFEAALEYPVGLGVGQSWRPADAPLRYRAGLACRAAGDEQAARRHWQAALQETHHPISSVERTYVEISRLRLGDGGAAGAVLATILAAAEEAQRQRPTALEGFLVAALAAEALGHREQAVAAYAQAVRLAPNDRMLQRLQARAKA